MLEEMPGTASKAAVAAWFEKRKAMEARGEKQDESRQEAQMRASAALASARHACDTRAGDGGKDEFVAAVESESDRLRIHGFVKRKGESPLRQGVLSALSPNRSIFCLPDPLNGRTSTSFFRIRLLLFTLPLQKFCISLPNGRSSTFGPKPHCPASG
jgi:hypothetical protein